MISYLRLPLQGDFTSERTDRSRSNLAFLWDLLS